MAASVFASPFYNLLFFTPITVLLTIITDLFPGVTKALCSAVVLGTVK